MRIILWTAYLLDLPVATAALAAIIPSALDVYNNCHPNSKTSELLSFWAPFLIVHLGGPDTITAYSLEDNELWLRRCVPILIQIAVSYYILLLTLPGCSRLPLVSIFMYIVGSIKCFELLWALRIANSNNLQDSMLGSPDPGPNYHKLIEERNLKRAQGYHVDIEAGPEPFIPTEDISDPESPSEMISKAYELFQTFKRLFVDLILTFEHQDCSQSFFSRLKPKDAFHIIEIELGFAYDMLYTKAKVAYSFAGIILRVTTVFCILVAMVGFIRFTNMNDYHLIDLAISFILFAQAMVMEICALFSMPRSDWLIQHSQTREVLMCSFFRQPKKFRWSHCMAQYNLLSVSLDEKPAFCYSIQKLFGIDQIRVLHRYKTYSEVSDNLQNLIHEQLLESMERSTDPKALCAHRGSFSLMENDCIHLLWSISEVEFHQSILIWHVATNLCYYLDDNREDQVKAIIGCMESKQISDYLLYLLITYPFMLPIGNGLIRYRDTCAEAERFFKEKGPITDQAQACKKLYHSTSPDIPPEKVKGDRSKSVLLNACRLTYQLKEMGCEQMWKVISQVWVEMLAYAATHCKGSSHAQQLRRGGELLTHVWLLMAHLGISEQFQVSQGHARARLCVQ